MSVKSLMFLTSALASAGLVLGGVALAIVGATRLLPFTVSFHTVNLFGGDIPWWVPLLAVGVISTALAYATSIASSEILGSRLSSFMGLLEVVAAAFYAWLLLGQDLRWPQLVGGALILGGIALVRAEKADDVPIEAGAIASERKHPDLTAASIDT